MALNGKSGFNLEDRVKKPKPTDTHTPTDIYTHDDTDTHTHNHVDIKQPEQKEKKEKRIQLLTYESLVDRMDAYAAKRGVKRVAVFEAAVTAYLDMVDPQD